MKRRQLLVTAGASMLAAPSLTAGAADRVLKFIPVWQLRIRRHRQPSGSGRSITEEFSRLPDRLG